MAFECLGTVGAVDPDRCEISDEKTEMFLVSNFSDHNELHTFLTYAIQELLRFCGFTPDLVDNWLLRLITLVENKDATDIFLPFLGTIRNGDSVISQKLLPHIALHIVISGPPEELENMRLEIVTVLEDQVKRGSGFSPEGRQLVAQTIFGLMDHSSRWIRDRQKAQGENGGSKEQTLIQREALLNIKQQIVKLEGGHVASGQSMIVDEPTDVISPQKQLQKYYEKAHEIYAAVDKPDGMEDSLRADIVGVLQRHPDWERELAPLSVESSLVLNNWEGLSRAVQVGSLESPEVIFGKVVDVLLNSDEQAFNEAMKDARIRLGNQILGASQKDAYKRMYDSAIYLHILHKLPLIDEHVATLPPPHLPQKSLSKLD
ncbi:hypothetical protein PtB15_16B353 [Puccinia triticina]|nr:hypothetical protein PtB15_16B353 [Puccinia triticina]